MHTKDELARKIEEVYDSFERELKVLRNRQEVLVNKIAEHKKMQNLESIRNAIHAQES
jgi:hypothetical protein